MKYAIRLLAACCTTSLLLITAPATAEGVRDKSCVASSTMQHLQAGQTRRSVHASLGTTGRRESARRSVSTPSVPPGQPVRTITRVVEIRSYRACERHKSYRLKFVRRTVNEQKAPFRLREAMTAVS